MVISAGLLVFRFNEGLEVFMAHSTNETRHWSFPKGELEEGEWHLTGAIREFREETGQEPYNWTELDDEYDTKPYRYLGWIQQNEKKIVHAHSVMNHTLDPSICKSNECEWPRGSGLMIPEIDDYKWVSISEAKRIINPVQLPLLERLQYYELGGKQDPLDTSS